jgi:hypothetical protein
MIERLPMARDILAELREEWYSESDRKAESVEEEIDDELLELEVLLRSRGTVVSGDKSVSVSNDEEPGEPE